jgi:PAS domain S-box-containing protein
MFRKRTQTSLLLAFSAAVLTALMFLSLFFIIGVKNRKYTYEDSKELAKEISRKVSSETEVYLSSAINSARLVAERAMIYRKLGGTRKDIIELMHQTLVANPDFMGVWTMWEPNAFDNRDKLFMQDTLYDKNGTMSFAFFKYGNSIHFERNDPADYEKDFYTQPMKARKELILDPFIYQYHGYEYIYYQTSAVFPVLEDSVFLGVFGIDINLDSLQYRLNRIKLYETGFLSLITGSGIIVSHHDSFMIDRNLFSVIQAGDQKKYALLNEGKELTIETISEFSHEPVFRFFYPVPAGRGTKPWYIMVEIPVDKATVRSKQLLYTAYGTVIAGLILLLYLIINIFDRRRYEKSILDSMQMMQASERSFRNIFDKTKHGIIIFGRDMKILAANQAVMDMTGYSLKEDLPLNITDLVSAEQHETLKERLAGIATGVMLTPIEYKVKYKTGENHIIEAETSVMDYYGQEAYLVMLRDVTHIKEAERKVLEAIIHTEENERSRIAQDLHDGLGPVLSTIKIYFQVFQDTKEEVKRNQLMEKLRNTIEEAIKGVSEISHNISPHVLKNYGFYAALKQFIHRIELTNLVHFNVDCSNEPELSENAGIILYRALTELINNSIRHSGCKNIVLIFHQDQGIIGVDYSDDGRGFDVSSVTGRPIKGFGVQNIINRVKALHGNIDITSDPGKGMHARINIPV